MGENSVKRKPWKVFVVLFIGMIVVFILDARSVGQFARKFDAVQPGMAEGRVVKLLGTPDYEGYSFQLGQEGGFEDAYKKALHSGSAKFLSWYVGMDYVFTIGIDKQGKVTIAEEGGT